MNHSKTGRLRLFFAIVYFIEGIITALFGLSFLYLTSIGVTPESLSVIIFIALVPLFFKPFAGILIDKFTIWGYGRRKPWLYIGIGLQGASFFCLSAIDPLESLNFYMLIMCLAVTALVIYDTSVDGFALDLSLPDEYSKIQFWMTSGRYLSVLIIPPIATGMASNLNWSAAFMALGAFSLFPIPILLTIKDTYQTDVHKFRLKDIRKPLVFPGIFICLLGFFTMLATSGTEEIYLGYLRDEVGVQLGIVGWFGTIFGVGVIFGAIIGVKLYSKLGRIVSNQLTVVLIFVSAILLSAVSGLISAVVAVAVFGLTMGILHVTVFSLGMTLKVAGVEATTFSIFSVFLVTGTVIGMTLSPWLAGHFGYFWTFVMNGLMGFGGALMLLGLKKLENPRSGLNN